LRECVVLLKSFLLVLPEDQLAAFQRTVRAQMQAPGTEALPPQHVLRRRRVASIEGQ
jgi:hypothetical protein